MILPHWINKRSLVFVLSLGLFVCLSACSLLQSGEDSAADSAETQSPEQSADAGESGASASNDSAAADADTSSTTKRKRLPTLREQMRSIEERQAAMQNDLQAIRTDLADVKTDVADLRRLVQESPLVTQSPNATGDRPVDDNSIDPAGDPETFLLPDEQAALATGPDNLLTPDSNSDEDPAQDDVSILQPDPPVKQDVKQDADADQDPDFNEPRSLASSFNPDQRIVDPPVFPQNYYAALNHVRVREYEAAVDSLLAVLDDSDDPFVRAKTQRWLGEAYYGAGNWTESISYFRDFLATDSYPEEVQAVLILLGNAHVKLDDTDQARKYFQQLVDTYPDGELVARARRMLQIL